MNQTVALIGYGAAALNAAISLRTTGYQGEIQAFSNAGALPYSPMMTASYAAGACDYQGMFPWDKADLAQLNVQVIADAPVTCLNVQERTITAGGQEYPYDLCLIASGAHPVGVGVLAAGAEKAAGAFHPLYLRTLEDARVLHDALTSKNASRILISGTSMVALKAVDACLAQGVEVTLLGRSEHIMRRTACD